MWPAHEKTVYTVWVMTARDREAMLHDVLCRGLIRLRWNVTDVGGEGLFEVEGTIQVTGSQPADRRYVLCLRHIFFVFGMTQ